VWDWYDSEEAFTRLTPEWEPIKPQQIGALKDGERTIFKMKLGPFPRKWIAEHHNVKRFRTFDDTMIKGVFNKWIHSRKFTPNKDGCVIRDELEWRLPLHFASKFTSPITVMPRLRGMFRYRSDTVRDDLSKISETITQKRKRILITGSTGLIGTELYAFLSAAGHDVFRLLRVESNLPPYANPDSVIRWNDLTGEIVSGSLENFDAVVHLAGAGIGDKNWSKRRKMLIEKSRTIPTEILSQKLSECENKPEVLISGSAIGWYGGRGNEVLTEESEPGEGFLPNICAKWESATQSAKDSGIRVVSMRTGIVVTAKGGMLQRLLLPAKFGALGPIGGGKQMQSWISFNDVIYSIHHLIMNKECEGPFNLTSPNPINQKDFAKLLGKVLKRPAFAPLPSFVVKLLFGEMGKDLILEGQNVSPKKLLDSGYKFVNADLESCLRHTLGKWSTVNDADNMEILP
jgi:hypothetical protein